MQEPQDDAPESSKGAYTNQHVPSLDSRSASLALVEEIIAKSTALSDNLMLPYTVSHGQMSSDEQRRFLRASFVAVVIGSMLRRVDFRSFFARSMAVMYMTPHIVAQLAERVYNALDPDVRHDWPMQALRVITDAATATPPPALRFRTPRTEAEHALVADATVLRNLWIGSWDGVGKDIIMRTWRILASDRARAIMDDCRDGIEVSPMRRYRLWTDGMLSVDEAMRYAAQTADTPPPPNLLIQAE